MVIWIDVQLSPAIAVWIEKTFHVRCVTMRSLGMQQTRDEAAFGEARNKADAVLTKDADFVRLVQERGRPPSVIWLRCGNTSDARLRHILGVHLAEAIRLVGAGEPLIEIGQNQ